MSDQIHVSPDGVKYRLVGNITTTPANDTEAKKVLAQTDCVEVIVSDSRLISRGSQFGHVAIIVNGVTYSRAHDGYDSKKTYAQYVATQQSFRNSVGYVLRVSPNEKSKIEVELKRRVAVTSRDPVKHGYSLLDNSCSSNVADVLNLVGIVAYDPRWSAFGMVSPEDIAVGLSRSKRVKEKRFYAKESP
ncbi:hypothetical protein R20233_01719 [Ralstonia sp. LMG 32965]|uniref:hypothetical protein n=1 Tax=Ralstonia flatus TaxID=3058601 RepID=UPI0028F531A8|nr:hypothetical protein [Ralstonia sp. LMG 32965]CAJ0870818.1 hypothetical protein R20233_01719 [Ralstonia sp. LMG 32965]